MSATTVIEGTEQNLTVMLGIGNKISVTTQNGDTVRGALERAAKALGVNLDLTGKQILSVPSDGTPAGVVEPDAPVAGAQAVVVDERRHNG